MRRIIAPFLIALAVAAAPLARAAEPLTVVELFTSQGCSSCPPADRLLGELAERDDVLALSEHVDYWDYLGWKDPFASVAASQRQRAYAARFDLPYVYTPQMVVQGEAQVVGSERHDVLREIAAQRPLPVDVDVRALPDQDTMVVEIGGAPAVGPAEIWLVFFDHRRTTDIRRGENRGRRLTYRNVVRTFERIGTWSGEPVSVPVDITAMADRGEACAVLVQGAGTGPIYGAARVDLPDAAAGDR